MDNILLCLLAAVIWAVIGLIAARCTGINHLDDDGDSK